MDDQAIIELFWQRSEDALAEVSARFGRYCRTIAVNILHSVEDADECVSDTWLRAWNAMPPARPNKLAAFLGRITRNLALDRYEAMRAQKRGGGEMELALEELADLAAPEKAGEGEISHAINAFLRSEAPEHRNIFLKRYLCLYSIKEIAAEYGYSESKVKSLLLRVRNRLKIELESEGLL
ncbi:MAG: sigma-70 family RNA polymerase sigma factor [Clostridiales Family XIII bacterium]|jgi:RNA polymerase sigma-70 factor (ECF subfamily)|nr:sigma-70 family RNA polymerase sigma factor [Clostridiales Family XIII bacterium]